MPTKFFGTVRPKILRKNVIPPFSSIIFFETKNFFKNSRISLRKFWALWDMKISTGNRDMPPLIHKFFSIPENFRKTEGFLYKAFRFGPVRQKVPTNPWCPPPMHENFRWKNFSEAPKCSPMKYFNSETKTPTENRDSPPPLIQTFSIPEIIATGKDSPTKIFGTVRQKNFDGKSWYSPPPYPNFFDTRNYCNNKLFPYKIFRHWDKKFSTENLVTPPLLLSKFFRDQKLVKH